MKYNVLILCEESQVEVIEFRRLGYNAYSCDIMPCRGGHPEWHIHYPAEYLLAGHKRFETQDGSWRYVPKWHMIIAHPPCTYLCRVGSPNLYINGEVDPVRESKMIVAADFFRQCLNAPSDLVAVENPIPMARAGLPRPSTYVQPYDFGHEYSKKTLLWLKNLPPLMPTQVRANWKQFVASTKGKYRSRSFQGIAVAMATQWGKYMEIWYQLKKNKNERK